MNATLPPLRPFPGSKWQAPQCKLIKSSMKQKQRVCLLSACLRYSYSLVATADIVLHPLVILNVTDHFTRQRVNNDAPQRVLGALLGIQQGRRVEIHTSFELVYDVVDGDIVIGCLSFEGGGVKLLTLQIRST